MAASLSQIELAAQADKLDILAAFRLAPPHEFRHSTMILIGPGPDFWENFTKSSELNDGTADPIDRWSARKIDALAEEFDAEAVYPFKNDPPKPFISWALQSGFFWQSPVGLLVHCDQGLWGSMRGAIIADIDGALPQPPSNPCTTCADKPCLSACPVQALTAEGYDTASCHSYLDSGDGSDCMSNGCIARGACPVSKNFARDPAQSAFHMKAFHP